MTPALVLLALATARAQDPAPISTEALEASSLYRLGLELVAQQQWSAACTAWLSLTQQHPDAAEASRVQPQLALLGAAHPETPCASSAGALPLAGEAPRRAQRPDDGRSELAISQALVGPLLFSVGMPLSIADGFNTPLVPVGLAFTGLGVGIGLPLALTRNHPISSGQAMSVYTGELLGAAHGLGLFWVAYPRVYPSQRTPLQFLTAGTLLGGAAGTLAAITLDPEAGDMALLRSGATWGALYGGMSFLIIPPSARRPIEAPLRVLGLSDLGAVGGVLLATRTAGVSRGRMNLINLSGYAGGVVGVGLATIAAFYVPTDNTVIEGILLTTATTAGLVTGVLLTRNVDQVSWLGGDGALLGHSEAGWRVGVPLPSVRAVEDGSLGLSLSLARGQF